MIPATAATLCRATLALLHILPLLKCSPRSPTSCASMLHQVACHTYFRSRVAAYFNPGLGRL